MSVVCGICNKPFIDYTGHCEKIACPFPQVRNSHEEYQPTSPLAQFDEAIKKVTKQRGQIYGHPLDDFGKVTHMAEAIATCPDAQLKHVLYMILVKVARLAKTPDHLDSWIDCSGYARTAAMILDKRQEKTPVPTYGSGGGGGNKMPNLRCHGCGREFETGGLVSLHNGNYFHIGCIAIV